MGYRKGHIYRKIALAVVKLEAGKPFREQL
jgi:hypothetical protein